MGREEREIYEMRSRFISATLDPDRENRVRPRRGLFARFLFAEGTSGESKNALPFSTGLSPRDTIYWRAIDYGHFDRGGN